MAITLQNWCDWYKRLALILEAYRRKKFLESGSYFLGLGFPSEYKSKFFKSSFGKLITSSNNWFTLTDKGFEKLALLENLLIIEPTDYQKINLLMFSENKY